MASLEIEKEYVSNSTDVEEEKEEEKKEVLLPPLRKKRYLIEADYDCIDQKENIYFCKYLEMSFSLENLMKHKMENINPKFDEFLSENNKTIREEVNHIVNELGATICIKFKQWENKEGTDITIFKLCSQALFKKDDPKFLELELVEEVETEEINLLTFGLANDILANFINRNLQEGKTCYTRTQENGNKRIFKLYS